VILATKNLRFPLTRKILKRRYLSKIRVKKAAHIGPFLTPSSVRIAGVENVCIDELFPQLRTVTLPATS
jgi:hypothetical protein